MTGKLPPKDNEEVVKSQLLALVDKEFPAGRHDRWIIQNQCAALLDDIKAGVFAACSLVEHYRLESIGYSQEEIAASGRASNDSQYHTIPLAKLIRLQKDY